MRIHTTPSFAAAKAAHAAAFKALFDYIEANQHRPQQDEELPDYDRLNKAEDAALDAWMMLPVVTAQELREKLEYAEQREMFCWMGWAEEEAAIKRDLAGLARHPISMRTEFMAWRAAQDAHVGCYDHPDQPAPDELVDKFCEASTAALRALLAAPCATPGDFMVKAYANLLGEAGSTWWGPHKDDGTGNRWDIDLKGYRDERDLNDAWVRSAYADLDGSDFGACLLSFGLPDFDAPAWLDRAHRVGLMAMLVEQADGTHALYLCEDAEHREPNDRIRCERERLRRIASYDPSRTALICNEIERAWPTLIARRAA